VLSCSCRLCCQIQSFRFVFTSESATKFLHRLRAGCSGARLLHLQSLCVSAQICLLLHLRLCTRICSGAVPFAFALAPVLDASRTCVLASLVTLISLSYFAQALCALTFGSACAYACIDLNTRAGTLNLACGACALLRWVHGTSCCLCAVFRIEHFVCQIRMLRWCFTFSCRTSALSCVLRCACVCHACALSSLHSVARLAFASRSP
jgi:hypothetical protein